MISIPILLLVLLCLGSVLAAVLGVALWSGRSQRYTRVQVQPVHELDQILPAFEGLVQSWCTEGNAVEIIENGSLLESMLADISGARSSVHLELYLWWQGDVCVRFAEALAEKAREGVEVRLLLDALGSWSREERLVQRMRDAGVRIRLYHDVRLRTLGRLNKRDHRKLCVIDARLAFVFGHGVAQEWTGDGDAPDAWRDLGARLRGPAVSRLQGVFAQSWMEESGELLASPDYFEAQERAGDVRIQVVASSPRGGVSNSSLLYRTLIARASERLLIANPYFSPGRDVADLIAGVARRGVEVSLLLPGPHTDMKLVKWAGHHIYEELLAAGVRIFEFQPTLNHQKVMVVDDTCAYLGSANFDERSFDINAEVGVVFWDDRICLRLAEIFERDLTRSKELELSVWKARAGWRRLRERSAFLLHQQL